MEEFEGDIEKLNRITELFNTFFISFPEENIILKQRDKKIFVYGLSQAGKTTVINCLKRTISQNTLPTTNVDISRVLLNNISILTYDAPGQSAFRDLWAPYLKNQDGLVFVFDIADPKKFAEAKDILHEIAWLPSMRNLPLLILLNKIDLVSPDIDLITKELKLDEFKDRDLKYFFTSGLINEGINDAFNWLAVKLSKGAQQSEEIELGVLFSRWDESTGLEVIGTYPSNLFGDPQIIAIKCFSVSQFVFGGEKFKKLSFILPFAHLKAKAAIYFDHIKALHIRGGELPLSMVVFYNEKIPSTIIDNFNSFILEKFELLKSNHINKIKVLEILEEIYNSILLMWIYVGE